MHPNPVIVGLGEVLWDVFPSGPRFGGAPANFVCNAAGLARGRFEVAMASAVGVDELGQRAISALVGHHVNVDTVARINYPTGQVNVRLDDEGHASYEFAMNTAWDRLEWSSSLKELALRTDVVCFGTLGQRSHKTLATIRRFVGATRPTALRILDINLRPPFYTDAIILDSIKLANVLKLNDEELPILASLTGITGSPTDMLLQLAKRYELQVVALTLGANGAILMQGDEVSQCPGVETRIVDTVGAGDAYTAAFMIGLLNCRNLETINRTACEVAAYVCSQSGATPILPDWLSEEL
ncbi:MAG TPA: carbohydrate kinase [Pirellula sp.]|nr:carbohydrate kinase [Pirellula sp.]